VAGYGWDQMKRESSLRNPGNVHRGASLGVTKRNIFLRNERT